MKNVLLALVAISSIATTASANYYHDHWVHTDNHGKQYINKCTLKAIGCWQHKKEYLPNQ